MNKRTLAVSFLTAGLTAGVIASAVGPAAAQGNPVGGQGNVYYLSGAGNTSGKAQDVLVFGDPGDEVFYGDWDNDGVDTPMVDRNGVFYVANQDGKTTDVFAYGNPGDKVIVGDWDGKNGDSMAVVRTEQGTNHFFVKNDVKSTGKADSEFFYGDAGDDVLVGDWDKDGKDTLMVHRADTSFHVKNDTNTGVADYSFFYGNPGDKVLVGDWADPATYTDGNAADQIAVRRDGNHYFLSNELVKGKDITALRDVYYGDPSDTVFVASLPTQVGDVGDVKVALDDVLATYKKGDTVLVQKANGDIVEDKDSFGDPKTYAGGEPKVQFKGAPQYYRGAEAVLAADGKPVKYVATADYTPSDPHEADLGTGTVPLYNTGDYVLNADGSLKYVLSGVKYVPDTQTAGATRTAHVGDVVLERRGAPVQHLVGTPAVYEVGGEYVANVDVETSTTNDYKLDANGDPTWDATNSAWVKNTAPIVKVGGFAPGTPVTEHRGEDLGSVGYQWTPAATARTFTGTVSSTTRSVTVSDGNFTAADIGRDIDGTNIPLAAKIVSVPSATTVTIDLDITTPVTGTVTLPGVTAGWGSLTGAAITDDEKPNLYVLDAAPATLTTPPAATDKKASSLDADTKSEPGMYFGTEPVKFVGGDDLDVSPYTGGQRVVSQKKGEVFLDSNGEQVQLTADDVWIEGDGLGVRRNFG
jgi:hypothetical protein